MKTLILSSNPAPISKIEDATFIQTARLRDTLLIAADDSSSSDIIIEAGKNAYSNAKIACQYKIKFFINGTTHTTSTMKFFEKSLFLFELAENASDCDTAKEYLINSLLSAVPSEVREEQAYELIKHASNNKLKTDTLSKFKKALQDEKDAVKATITISENNSNVTFVDVPYGDKLANHIVNQHNSTDSLNIINGFMAGGKSTTLVKAFNKFCEQGNTPITTGCSRALMSSLLPKNDPRLYTEAMKTSEIQKGLLGVVNTILMTDRFSRERALSEVLMIDEIEEVLNHMSGAAVGEGKLDDMTHIYSRFEEQFKKSKTVIVADALTSEFTLDYLVKLAKESGKKVFAYGQKAAKKKPVVKVMTEEMNITAARKNLMDNKKVAVFCDGSHNGKRSSFNALYNSINPTNGFSVKVDAAFMQSKSTAKRLSDADALADDMVAIFYNTAAKCGLSIQNGEYKNTHVFANYTAAPNEIIQAPGRPRDTENIFLSFGRINHKLPPQTDWAILSNIMNKECTPEDFTKEKQDNLFENEMVKTVLARIEYKNKMKKNYKNKVLMMHEILGYEIEYVTSDEVNENKGMVNKRNGSKVEKALRTKGVISANKISKDDARELRKCGDFNSQARKNELESYNLRSFYIATEVTEGLMKFDNAGRGRKAITNMMIARGTIEGITINSQIKQKMVDKFFETTGLNPFTFGTYSKSNANRFQYFLNTGEINIGERTVTAKEAFAIAFPESNITSGAMDTIRSVLIKSFMFNKTLIVKTDRAGNANKDWNYVALNNIEAETRYKAINPKRIDIKTSYEDAKTDYEKTVTDEKADALDISIKKPKKSIQLEITIDEIISADDLIKFSEDIAA